MTRVGSMDMALTLWAQEELANTSSLRISLSDYFDSPQGYREDHLSTTLSDLVTHIETLIWLWSQGVPNPTIYQHLVFLAEPSVNDTEARTAIQSELLRYSRHLSSMTRAMLQSFMDTHLRLQRILAPAVRAKGFRSDIPGLQVVLQDYVYLLRRLQGVDLPREVLSVLLEYIRPYEA